MFFVSEGIARYGVSGVSTCPIGCDTPSPFSERFLLGGHAKWMWEVHPSHKGVSQRYLRDTTRKQGKWVRYPRLRYLKSEELEKAGTVDFKKHPARKVGTRSRQCGNKVPSRFAFPGARNPSICSIWRFGKNFPAIFPEFSRNFPPELPQRPRKQPQPSRVFWSRAAKRGGFPIWTCPSFFVLFCPFWDFPDFSGIFPICSGMVRGFSRFVLFLFLGLLRAPTRNSPERVRPRHNLDLSQKKWEPPGFGNPPV